MKKLLLLLIILLPVTKTFATHNLAAQITYRHLSGFTYEATITTYTKISAPADHTELEIFWGDGQNDTIPRTNGNGMQVAMDIKVNIYVGTHTYAGPGSYTMYFVDQNRNQGIINILNSVNVAMYVESKLEILPGAVYNNSVQFLAMPSFNAILNYPYKHNITAYDPDGDCLTYDLVACRMSPGIPVPTYSFPQASNTININRASGEITWDSPVLQGEYALAVQITEWRNGIAMGYVVRDFAVAAIALPTPQFNFNGNNTWQLDTLGNYSYTLAAGDSVELTLSYTDLVNTPINLVAHSETFALNDSASFSKSFIPSTLLGVYKWTPAATSVRSAPYVITFRGSSTVNTYGAFNSDISLLIYVLDANTYPCTITTQVNEFASLDFINLYPNPATQSTTLSFSHPHNKAILKLLTIKGETVLTKTDLNGNTFTINLSSFANGIYIAEVINGLEVARVKLVKE